jgi:hypothetical protein
MGYTIQVVIRMTVFVILLISLISKFQGAPAILRGSSLLSNWYLLAAAVSIEAAVAIWALVAPARWVWVAVTCLFVALTMFATWAFFANQECNCFGNFLPSGSSMPINIVVITAMLLTRKQFGIGRENIDSLSYAECSPNLNQLPNRLSVRLLVACVTSLAVATITAMALCNSLKTRTEMPDIKFLLADAWVGKTWPIDENFDAKLKKLSGGKWLVLIFRSDCEHCKDLAMRIAEQQASGSAEKAAIVSLVAGSSDWPVHIGRASTSQESDTMIHWHNRDEPFVASPAAFLLDEGRIVDAKDGEKTDTFVERILKLP